MDKGAIKPILKGSDIMCPGLTSEGGELIEVEENTRVVVRAFGK